VRPDSLADAGAVVGVLDDFELVLLVGVEEAGESCRGQVEGLGDDGGEEGADGGHLAHVLFEGGAEGGEAGGAGPLIGS